RSSARDNPVQEPRSAGSQYGVRSPDRCGTKIGSSIRPAWSALAYSSAQLAFMTSRTQFRLSPALRVAPIWYQPAGVADRYRLTPAPGRPPARGRGAVRRRPGAAGRGAAARPDPAAGGPRRGAAAPGRAGDARGQP